ncbi:MAG: hypothetical protein SVR08_16820, partial [Spirochaetota bacterium]|nr:hypothetical protein [Spirochaetota bacterium]
TAEDMDDIVVSVPLDAGEISVEVTPGNDRNFSVIALVADDDTGLVRSYKGETIADLGAGEEVSLSILMRIYETAIIIPDYGNNRLVKINDITGSGWEEYEGPTGWDANFQPFDVDLDSEGKIYIANNNSTATYSRIIKIDDISGSNLTQFEDKGAGISAVGVDRSNNYIYYATVADLTADPMISSGLYRAATDGVEDTAFNDSINTLFQQDIFEQYFEGNDDFETDPDVYEGAFNICGIDIDESGNMYLAVVCYNNDQAEVTTLIIGYNPSLEGQGFVGAYLDISDTGTLFPLLGITDILIKLPHIYIANSGGTAGYDIVRVNTSENALFEISGNLGDNVSESREFYGPWRFVGEFNEKILILDHDGASNNKIISLDVSDDNSSIVVSGWQTYGTTGSGEGQFQFYQ